MTREIVLSFGADQDQDWNSIAGLKVQASCLFVLSDSPADTESQAYFKLQIRGNYMVQVSVFDGGVLAGFQFNEGVCFRILTVNKNSQQKDHRSFGFQLIFEDSFEIQLVKSSLNSQRQFQQFCLILSSKYIRQLGFQGKFKPQKVIGRGISSSVLRAMRVKDNKLFAIKAISKQGYLNRQANKSNFEKEFKIMTMLSHPNLVGLHSVYQTHNSVYMVMELLEFSFLEYIRQFGFPELDLIKSIIRRLLEALRHLHAAQIFHRDIKLENLMFRKEEDGHLEPVIIDFGLADFTNSSDRAMNKCGTPGYIAPEILVPDDRQAGFYDQKCDIFSLGVVCHILLTKKPVFHAENIHEVIKLNQKCEIDFSAQAYQQLSKDSVAFLKGLLAKHPQHRMGAEQALVHPFVESGPITGGEYAQCGSSGQACRKVLSQTNKN